MSQLKQISRPFQIMLVATVVLFALWLVVLRNHSSSGESSPSTASSSAQPASPAHASGSSSGSSGASGSSAGGSTHHASAPGVAGLTRAIAKARGAVAQSEQNGRQLQHKENQASGGSAQSQASNSHSSAPTTAKPHAKTAPAPAKTAPGSAAKSHTSPSTTSPSSSSARAKAGIPAMQSKVEAQLKHGQLVAILLWNPKGSVDKVARRELQAVRHAFGAKLAVHVARSSEVGSFGTFTRTVQVYSTPTILLINHKGATSSVTGLTDAFSIEQAVREAEQAS